MNISAKRSFDRASLRMLYRRYKSYGISICVIFIAISLLMFFVLPQISEFITYKNDEARKEDRISLLNRNLQFLSELNEEELNTQLDIATSALPAEKDFLGVLGAISFVANRAGVSVDDYSFSVGELGSGSARLRSEDPPIVLALEIDGSTGKTTDFIDGLLHAFPLAEVTLVELSQNSSRVTVGFQNRSVSNLKLSDSRPLSPLSSKEVVILEQLRTWQGQRSFSSSGQTQ